MIIKKDTCKLALVQAAPVMFDKDKCVEKIIALIGEAAAKGAELIVFPELFIPGYPWNDLWIYRRKPQQGGTRGLEDLLRQFDLSGWTGDAKNRGLCERAFGVCECRIF